MGRLRLQLSWSEVRLGVGLQLIPIREHHQEVRTQLKDIEKQSCTSSMRKKGTGAPGLVELYVHIR